MYFLFNMLYTYQVYENQILSLAELSMSCE